MDISKIILNKNRGWRGLAQLQTLDKDNDTIMTMIFSFSQAVWDDMLHGYIVTQDKDNYYVIEFDNTEKLPSPMQQRSVLIKNFIGNVDKVNSYSKNTWVHDARADGHYDYIYNFTKNRNNHTTSDWNCIGIRVTPMI